MAIAHQEDQDGDEIDGYRFDANDLNIGFLSNITAAELFDYPRSPDVAIGATGKIVTTWTLDSSVYARRSSPPTLPALGPSGWGVLTLIMGLVAARKLTSGVWKARA